MSGRPVTCIVLLMQWQGELKRRAGPGIAGGRQPSSVRVDDRAADRQAHAHAAGFGGEEGIEQPIGILGGHADTAVAHRDQNLAGLILSRPDHQLARPVRDRLHRFNAVDDEVEDDLLQLDPIGEDQGQGRGEFQSAATPGG